MKDLWSCRLWCYVYKSGGGNDSGTKTYKQTPHTTAKCHDLSKHRLCLHLMESEKQYYMCQEIRRAAANETWHTKSHNSAIRNDWARVLLSWINIRGQTDLVNTQLLTFIEMHWMEACIKQRILRWDFMPHRVLKKYILHLQSQWASCRGLRINALFFWEHWEPSSA